jgi:hypothetical protein
MNDKNYICWKNAWMQKLDRDSRRHIGCFRYGENETDEHRKGKQKVIDDYIKVFGFENIEFLTECFSENRIKRADVIIFFKGNIYSKPIVVEVAVNESIDSIREKKWYWEEEGFDFEVRDHEGIVCKIE